MLQESIAINTKLLLQPLPLQKLQALLRQLLLSASSSTTASFTLGFSSSAAAATQRRKVKVRKSKASMYDPKAVSKSESLHTEMTALSSSILFKAAGDPIDLLTLTPPSNSSALLDMDSLITGTRLQTVKALFNGDTDQAAKAVSIMLSQPKAKQLMTAGDPAVSAAAPEAGAEGTGQHSASGPDSTGNGAWTPQLHPDASADSHAVAASGDAAASGEEPLQDSSSAAVQQAAGPEAAADATGEEALRMQSQLSPEQLSELLWELLDVWHDVLEQQQEQHQREQQLLKDEQELQEALLQIGMDPQEAQEEARKTAEKRAQQQVLGGVGKLGGKPEKRWWRQQELPAVFGSSSEEADLQLECVSAAAGELVEKLAGRWPHMLTLVSVDRLPGSSFLNSCIG